MPQARSNIENVARQMFLDPAFAANRNWSSPSCRIYARSPALVARGPTRGVSPGEQHRGTGRFGFGRCYVAYTSRG